MTEQPTVPERVDPSAVAVERDDSLHAIAMDLLAAFEGIGPEHHALTAEARETTATERRGTLRRMIQAIADATSILAQSVDLVAKSYGLYELGINRQMSRGDDGGDYSALILLGDPDETLYEAALSVQTAVQLLGEAYKPTKKYPGLATARRPQEITKTLTSLRRALTALSNVLVARGQLEDSAEFTPCIEFLGELETRTCIAVPPQRSGPTAEDVTAAILADPEIARAAATALESAGI
ncbi:hypothetical protein ACFXI8_26345 [Streptomyces niveus]|uniref:hypothetical protein n=1 Tax=Streptomyces niveus TaxID=193462 RepID=UPI0036C3620B